MLHVISKGIRLRLMLPVSPTPPFHRSSPSALSSFYRPVKVVPAYPVEDVPQRSLRL
jgi:hypothetical protein